MGYGERLAGCHDNRSYRSGSERQEAARTTSAAATSFSEKVTRLLKIAVSPWKAPPVAYRAAVCEPGADAKG